MRRNSEDESWSGDRARHRPTPPPHRYDDYEESTDGGGGGGGGREGLFGRGGGGGGYSGPVDVSPVHTEPRGPATPTTTKSAYLLDLEAQVEEKKQRQEAEKRRQIEADIRREREAAQFSYFGKPGGGAPIRDDRGNVITSVKGAITAQAEGRQSPADPGPGRRFFGSALAPIEVESSSPSYSTRITTPARSTPSAAKSEYLRALEEQIAEKNARKRQESAEREEWERKKDAELGVMDYFGSGGGGAPLKAQGGGVVSDLRSVLPPSSIDGVPMGAASPGAPGSGGPRRSRASPSPDPRARRGGYDTGASPTPEYGVGGGGGGERRDSLPGIRHHASVPTSRSGTPSSSGVTARNEVVDMFREQNTRLRHDVSVLEDKLAQALDILDRYRELYGPLPPD